MQKYCVGKECKIRLLSLEEWKAAEGDYPYKRKLYRAMNPVLYCKIERTESCFFGTVKVPRYSDGEIKPCTFGFYMHEKELVLIEDGSLLPPLLAKMQGNADSVTDSNHCLLVLFEMLMEDDMPYLLQQEEKLAALEEKMLQKLPEHFYGQMTGCRRQLQAYHSFYEQMIHMGDFLQEEAGRDWLFYTARVERLHGHVRLLQDYLVQIRDLYQSLLNVQQNKVMGMLTVVTTIFLPLTLIAGWYGMNFPNMPEFRWRYGYVGVVCISMLIIIIEIYFFKKKKML